MAIDRALKLMQKTLLKGKGARAWAWAGLGHVRARAVLGYALQTSLGCRVTYKFVGRVFLSLLGWASHWLSPSIWTLSRGLIKVLPTNFS